MAAMPAIISISKYCLDVFAPLKPITTIKGPIKNMCNKFDQALTPLDIFV